ncbi:calmodulin-lysine N-methyltransferase-like [Diadema setosum]|uniref:calmodulin-lysine N-methyltransferase-like n=1 Tax=Diadema setosum TaxID=31175 RepID=UPI003B3A683F
MSIEANSSCPYRKEMNQRDQPKKQKGSDVARQRWLLLGKALRQGKCTNGVTTAITSDVSVRRFTTYKLLSARRMMPNDGREYAWFEYTCPSHQAFCVQIRHLMKRFSPEDLIGFNNTGNVCVWPSEEILAYHCLKEKDQFRGKTVCELGGGMSCLAGIAVATTTEADRVILTDGNKLSCDNIQVISKRNQDKFGQTQVETRELRWNEPSSYADLRECVDVILCADCLFFDQYRTDLVDTIDSLLARDGKALIFAPRRGHTLEKFCQKAKERFHLALEDNYDSAVWNVYQEAKVQGKEIFDEDIHYPLQIILTRRADFTAGTQIK